MRGPLTTFTGKARERHYSTLFPSSEEPASSREGTKARCEFRSRIFDAARTV